MKTFIEKVTLMMKAAGLSHKYIDKVFEDSAEKKAELNELLGLNAENFYRKTMPISMTDDDFNQMYPFVLAVFKNIPGWAGTFKPTSGKLTVGKDQVNITKFLAKALEEGRVPNNYREHLMQKLGIDLYNPKAVSQIVPKLGELLNKKDTNVVVVSTNPFDFFTSSAGDYKYASFKSCYRPGGEYFNGCNSLARDSFSTIAYKANTDKIDYKHGRAWMFVLDKLVAQTKSYGTFTNTERNIAREYVQSCLAQKHTLDYADYRHHQVQKWKKRSNASVLYFDDYSIDVGYPAASYPGGFSDTKAPEIKFSNARCLKCGKETQYPTQGICGVCSGNYKSCHDCNADLYGGREITAEGHSYCPDCIEKKFEPCGHCGNYHTKGTATEINGEKICPACIKNRFFFCNHCNTYHKRDDITRHNITDLGETWCATCFKKDGFTCKDCGEKHSNAVHNQVNLKGNIKVAICNNCIKAYSTCPKCQVAFKDGHETCDGTICSDCFTGYDFCTHCATFVLKESMMFDGEVMSCTTCMDKRKATDASHDLYAAEVAAIIAAVAVAETEKTGEVVQMLAKAKEERERTGYKEGDILRVTKDTAYHQYKVGALVTNCKKYAGIEGQEVYCTFRDKMEWFVMASDVEFARPALVPGDTFVSGGATHRVDSVKVNANDSFSYIVDGKEFAAEQCTPTDVIDPAAFAAISYRAGEVVTIVANVSKHPFANGDKVKVVHVDEVLGTTRYVVKKAPVKKADRAF